MKLVYPVVLHQEDDWYIVSIPDCRIHTEGHGIADAISMARDALSLWCVCEQDAGRELPAPSAIGSVEHSPDELVTLVDADINAYRKRLARAERRRLPRAKESAMIAYEFQSVIKDGVISVPEYYLKQLGSASVKVILRIDETPEEIRKRILKTVEAENSSNPPCKTITMEELEAMVQ
ncbi:MAG: type II toxin-antitoxin system HicB family antitoxin [Treponema sp.]|jgi:predicted RNase H-like HicB family nuclease|nr:type II toxin-antitoxin system HicB family antitoxin [Treponema sp.]